MGLYEKLIGTLSKASLFFFTLALLRCMQPIYVARNDVNSRQNTIAEIKRRTSSKGLWTHLAIFPEGKKKDRKRFLVKLICDLCSFFLSFSIPSFFHPSKL